MLCHDGGPTDNLRWRGDALGDRVLTVTEHIRMSDADFSYHLDLLEQCAPTYVPIYATEWAKSYIHNIIFYSYDREVMKRLRVVLLAELDFTRGQLHPRAGRARRDGRPDRRPLHR